MGLNTGGVRLLQAATLTIASGAISPTGGLNVVVSETGTADNLDTIHVTNFAQLTDGSDTYEPFGFLRAQVGHTITITNGVGNIKTNSGSSATLTDSKVFPFIKVGATIHVLDSGAGGGSGTVTSVGLTMPSEFSVSSSPVTSSGTLAVSKANQSANQVFAGPTTGSPAQPAFRALVSDDLPTIPIIKGGTGATTQTAAMDALSPTTSKGDLLVDNGTSVVRLSVGTNGHVLTADSVEATGLKWASAGAPKVAILQDQKSSGTAGQTVAQSVWVTRDLNTEVTDSDSIVTLSSNKFTPVSGTYNITVTSSIGARYCWLRLRNVTTATVVVYGNPAQQLTALQGYFTANGTDEYEIQILNDGSSSTLPLALSEGITEVYTTLRLEKVA